jgi:AcrR family transcriptional regulator
MEKPHGKEEVKEAIIKASIPLIAESGVERVSFREIAAAANVNQGLITRHFGTKKELVKEISGWLFELMFREAKDRGETIQTLWNSGFSNYSMQIRAMTRIMLEPLDTISNPNPSVVEDVLKWVDAEQTRLVPKTIGDSKILVFIIASLMFGGELIEPYMQKVFDIPKDVFSRLKSEAFQAVISELQSKPSAFPRFRRRPELKG